jgi:disease resistance protein RPM1
MEGTAQTILSNVGQLMGKEFRKVRAVGGEVAELRNELATMHALLHMQTEADDGAVDHFIRECMKQVRELAYDAEDCVDLYIFRIRCQRKDGFLVWSKRLLGTLFPRHRLAGKIKALRARAVSISERHARYGISREALRRSPSLAPVMTAASSARALRPANHTDQIVGLEDQANTLAEMVKVAAHDNGEELKVFSIVGFGGLGKTTLAMEVCRQLEVEFDRQAQVSVSQMFDVGKDLKELLKRVLRQIAQKKESNDVRIQEEDPLRGIDTLDADQLASMLHDLLHDKRYIITYEKKLTSREKAIPGAPKLLILAYFGSLATYMPAVMLTASEFCGALGIKKITADAFGLCTGDNILSLANQ